MTNGTVATPSFIIKTTDSNYELSIHSINFYQEEQNDMIETYSNEKIETASDITANLNLKNSWGNISQFDLEIANNSDITLTNWEIKYEVPEETKIINIWGGNYILKENILIITGSDDNKLIENNTTNSNVGFQIETAKMPANLKLISFKGVNSNQEDVEIVI